MNNQTIAVIKVVFIPLVFITFSGCSSKELYESIQPKHDENECRKKPPYEYEECMKHKAKSYEEYKKDREEVINKA